MYKCQSHIYINHYHHHLSILKNNFVVKFSVFCNRSFVSLFIPIDYIAILALYLKIIINIYVAFQISYIPVELYDMSVKTLFFPS